jgi:hypothetical protein
MDERVWLRHEGIADPFHCPAGAVKDWQDNGWEPCDPPQEVNPVTAERSAWLAEQRAADAAAKSEAKSGKNTKE